jgi:hypothetical protein
MWKNEVMAIFRINSALDIGDDITVSGDLDLAAETLDGDGLSLREALLFADATPEADTLVFASNPGEAFASGGLIRLSETLEFWSDVTLNGDINGDGIVDITISGDTAGDDLLTTLPTGQSVTATTNTNSDDNVQTIFVGDGDVVLNGVLITGGNSVVADAFAVPVAGGGGVEIAVGASIDLTNSTIAGNVTNGYGGGVLNYGTLNTTSTYIAANAGIGGGVANYGTALFTGTTIEGNSGLAYGAFYSGGSAAFVNSTIVGNQSDYGIVFGDVVDAGGGISFVHSTITGNSGGLASSSGGAGALLQNSLVIGNGSLNFSGALQAGSASTHIGNFLGLLTDDVSLFFADVVDGVAQAGDNGGLVRSVALLDDWENPAVDAGDANNGSLPPTDALGNDRSVDFPSPFEDLTQRPDLGAFELQINPLRPLPVITTDLSAPDSLQSFVLTLDFGMEVNGFDLAHLDLTNATVVGELTTPDSHVFQVTLLPTAPGQVVVDLLDGVTGASSGLASYPTPAITLDEFDFAIPVVTLTTDADQSVFGSDIEVTISFDREVSGFEASDLVITNGELRGPLVQIDATTYSATVQYGGFAEVQIEVAIGAVQTENDVTNAAGASKTITIIEEPSLRVSTNGSGSSNTDGQTSLEEAIAYANSNPDFSAITFSEVLFGREIIGIDLLLASDLSISGDIDGNGTADVSISGAGFGSIFDIQSGASVSLEALQLVDGYSEGTIGQQGVGSAIENHGTLTLERVTILGNDAQGATGLTGATGENGSDFIFNHPNPPHKRFNPPFDGEEGGDGGLGGTGQHAGAILNYGMIEVSDSWLTSVATGAVSNLGYGENTASGGTGGIGGVGGIGHEGTHAIIRHPIDLSVADGGLGGTGGDGGLGGQGASSAEGIVNFGQAVFNTHIVGQLGSSTAFAGVGGSGGYGGEGGRGGEGITKDVSDYMIRIITVNFVSNNGRPPTEAELEGIRHSWAEGAGDNSYRQIYGNDKIHQYGSAGDTAGVLMNIDDGTGSANVADSIVYLHSAISSAHERQTPIVTINVNRLGDLSEAVSVGVRVVASGQNSVNAADFVGGVLPQSTIAFTSGSDTDSSFSFELVAGNYGEGVESLTVELYDLQDEDGGPTTALGTSAIHIDVQDNLVRETIDSSNVAHWHEQTVTFFESGEIETADYVMDDGTTRHQAYIVQDDVLVQRVTYDGEGAFSGNTWATKTDTLNNKRQVETTDYVMDDGTTRHQTRSFQDDVLVQRVTYDGEGAFSGNTWATKTDTLNSQQQVETVDYVMDDGTTRHQTRSFQDDVLVQRVTYDGEGAFSGNTWATKTDTLYKQQQVETVDYVMDDGTTRHQVRTFQDDVLVQHVTHDGDGAFNGTSWATKTDTFDFNNAITQRDYLMDDGDTIEITYSDGQISKKIYTDVNDDSDFSEKIEIYSVDGELVDTQITWDI